MHRVPEFGTRTAMLDSFDLTLLDLLQQDDARTADSLAADVPLSPSAIARRVRRLRTNGWIARTIALLSPRLTSRRLRAMVLVQLSEHADLAGKQALLEQILSLRQIQFCYEITGVFDFILMFDCVDMEEFTHMAEAVLVSEPIVQRYETSFVRREHKFAPYVPLREAA
jgi:DNA-binding Lrp family transcriptional regulator